MENQDQMHNQKDVAPSEELDKLVSNPEELPETGGTGGNRPVHNSGSVIIKDEGTDEGEQEDEESR